VSEEAGVSATVACLTCGADAIQVGVLKKVSRTVHVCGGCAAWTLLMLTEEEGRDLAQRPPVVPEEAKR
jgi:hypothetical protein